MRQTKLSRPTGNLIAKGFLILSAFALLAVDVTPGRLTPIAVRAASAQVDNMPDTCTELGDTSIGAAALSDYVWTGKKALRVQFLDGSKTFKEKVRQYADVWSRYANIRFVYVETGPSDIRVSFAEKGSSWSYIGSSAETVNRKSPTMNFGHFSEKTTEDEFRRIILHEFGHALGLIHEQQSPAAGIKWNKPAVYKFYAEQFGWNENVVNDNIFNKYKGRRIRYTAYDPDSIMHYPIPASFTLNGYSADWKDDLSEKDKEFIRRIYP